MSVAFSADLVRRATMADDRPIDETPPLEHDEYHSALEVDDTSGWRVYLVPALALLFVIGALAFIALYGSA
jgi:hypothetical protein